MRTSSLLVLGLVLVSAYVSSAPVDKPLEVAKRDQEMIMFGNQQNDPRVMKKKSDPALPVVADENTVDKQGFIQAVPVNEEHFIPQEKEVADDSSEQSPLDQAEVVIPPIKQQVPENSDENNVESSEETVESSEPAADADSVEEELKGVMADSSAQEEVPEVEAPSVEETQVVEETPVIQETPMIPAEEAVEEVEEDKETPEEPEEEQEQASVEQPKQEQEEVEMTELWPYEMDEYNPLDDFYEYLMGRHAYYRRRRSSRPTRAVTEGGMVRNELTRSKRIKRDLFEDENGLYYDPYGEETYAPELSEDDVYGLYQVDPKYEDEVETLLDMYEQAPEEPSYEAYEPYEEVPMDEVYPELYEELQEEEEEPEYVPSKRQMMSSLPGIKKRYFYPFSREPQTHWGAFIPEKRDYDQTYRRLLALASALSEESPYYQAYRKK